LKLKSLPFEDLNFLYFGPDLFWGPMPTVVYFTIDAHSSLAVDPFNQPIVPMMNHSMRVFSIDLPEHGSDLDPHTALERWAKHYQKGTPLVERFIEKLTRFLDYLHQQTLIDHRLGVMGLSRGAFIAAHLAHASKRVKHLVGFSPLTDLSKVKEFQQLPTLPDLPPAIGDLKNTFAECSFKIFIGNQDTRVSTHRALGTVLSLADEAAACGIKSPPIEGVIYPSIGHMGHGTPPHIFEAGSLDMVKKLGFLNGL
jgi:esterase FrsA